MFELPEVQTLATQMGKALTGKIVEVGSLGTVAHRFVWYNRQPAEFAALTHGRVVGEIRARGRWLFAALEPGYVLVLGEFGGKALYHQAGEPRPSKRHLLLEFTDGTAFSVTTQMWGAMDLFVAGEELKRQYIGDMRPTPVDAAFTLAYFESLIGEVLAGEKRSAKALLTQDQLIPGLGNAIAQDILFRAGLHARRPVADLTRSERQRLFRAIRKTVTDVIKLGGRNDEYDLYNHPGRYVRLMCKDTAGHPCPACDARIKKEAYLGGACYFCPNCQPLKPSA